MATRSSSGTGVVVSLVVFVLCTVFLLVLSIVFYSGKAKATQAEVAARSRLARYVTDDQLTRPQIKQIAALVNPAQNESVVRTLMEQYEDVMQYVSGSPSNTFDNLQNQFKQYGVDHNSTVRSVLQQINRDLQERQMELDSKNTQLAARDQEIEDLSQRIDDQEREHKDRLKAVSAKVDQWAQAADEYRAELQAVKNEYYAAIDNLEEQYRDEISRLENSKDSLFMERSVLKERLDQLEGILGANRLKVQKPETLVDAVIVDTLGGDEVYINRGKKDRIVLGMTFEVYDNPAALQQVDPVTGQLPRGKASLQTTLVRDTTSKCKITRAVPGRPVVRDDVVANAVYDPKYVFKFMVHGKFDVDGDGKPTETEAEYIRSLIVNWGGAVVTGETLPGDLDFLVLGVEPPPPMRLPPDATEHQIDDWLRKRLAYEKYDELFKQASDAQIPVLNSNRFFILIGYTDR